LKGPEIVGALQRIWPIAGDGLAAFIEAGEAGDLTGMDLGAKVLTGETDVAE
jgi:hypothetical protein